MYTEKHFAFCIQFRQNFINHFTIRESLLDEAQGADCLMVKPAGAYLDIVRELRERTELPIGAYQVSGEYAMIKFAALDIAAIGCICLMAIVAVMEERKIRREKKIQQLTVA